MFFKLQLYITKAILLTNSPRVFNLAVQVQIPLFSKKKKKTKQNKKKKGSNSSSVTETSS